MLTGLGLDATRYLQKTTTPDIKEALKKQTEDAANRGLFGAPGFLVGSELFWGNDRLDDALALAATTGTGW